METNNDLGEYLKHLREQKEYSVNQLALKSGISNAQISRIETGKRKSPKPETLRNLAEALDVPYGDLMTRAGYTDKVDVTEPQNTGKASSRDMKDFRKFLSQSEIMFDGVPLTDEDKARVQGYMEAMFWEAKKMNKRKKKDEE